MSKQKYIDILKTLLIRVVLSFLSPVVIRFKGKYPADSEIHRSLKRRKLMNIRLLLPDIERLPSEIRDVVQATPIELKHHGTFCCYLASLRLE